MLKISSLVDVIEFRKETYDRGITFINDENDEVFVSYNQLYNRALDILFQLQLKGITQGQELVFQIEDNEAFLYMFWACILGKIIPVPVTVGSNDEHRLKLFRIWKVLKNPYLVCSNKVLDNLKKYVDVNCKLSDLFENIKARTIIYEKFEYTGLKGEVHDAKGHEIAFVQFSSGSTGNPKGVTLTHENVVTNILAMGEGWGFTLEDVSLSWMPLTHDMGIIAFHLASIGAGVQQYLMPTKLFINKPVLWISKVNEHNASWIFSPNFGYMYFLTFFSPEFNYGWDLSCVKYVVNGAEPISTEICDEFMNKLATYGLKKFAMKAVYGLAEATVGVSFTPSTEEYRKLRLDRRFLRVGQTVRQIGIEDRNGIVFAEEGVMLKDCYARICDNDGKLVDDFIVGEIQISGKNVTKGYYNDSIATEKTITKDGWLNTGDLGFLANGRLVCVGRAKDIIFVNGQNFYPHDIERVAESFKDAKFWSTAACGIFNEEQKKEEIILFVVFKRKLEEFVKLTNQLRLYILKNMGLYINHIIPIKKMPKTTSGKTMRYKLVEQYNDGEFLLLINNMKTLEAEIHNSTQENNDLSMTEKNLLDIYRKVFRTNEISINDNFIDCGGNSMMLMQVSVELEKLYPGKVNIANLFAYPTIRQLSEFIDCNENISVPSLRLPEQYFIDDKYDSNVNSFETIINEDLYYGLVKIAKSIEVEVSDILLSMYIYLLKEITSEDEIPVYTAIDFEIITLFNLNFNNVKEYESYFKLVSSKLAGSSSSITYSPKDLYKARILKNRMSIMPIFYKRGTISIDTKFIQLYDLAFEIYENGRSIEVVCEFNRRLKGEKVKELLKQYLWLITGLVKSFAKI